MIHVRLRAAAGNRGGIPTDGLIAHYTMDNISGSTLVDETGNYDGTISGAVTTTGVIGDALSFDGANDYVSTPLPINTSTTYSLSAWIFKDNVSTTNARLLISGGFGGDPDGLSIHTEAYETAAVSIGGEASTSVSALYIDGASVALDSGFPLSEWHHVVVIATVSSTDGAAHYIGANNNNTNNFDGSIDQFRLYNRALTASEALALYNEGA